LENEDQAMNTYWEAAVLSAKKQIGKTVVLNSNHQINWNAVSITDIWTSQIFSAPNDDEARKHDI